MKTNKYLFILLAAGVLVGCGNKTTNTSDEAVKHDTVIVVQQVPDEQPLIDDAEIIAAEANIPDEVEKRDIGTLKSFFTDQGRAAAYLVGKTHVALVACWTRCL